MVPTLDDFEGLFSGIAHSIGRYKTVVVAVEIEPTGRKGWQVKGLEGSDGSNGSKVVWVVFEALLTRTRLVCKCIGLIR